MKIKKGKKYICIITDHGTLIIRRIGGKGSKKKYNKEKQKLCKIDIQADRDNLKLEGNFQWGYPSKISKKYEGVKGKPLDTIPKVEEKPKLIMKRYKSEGDINTVHLKGKV